MADTCNDQRYGPDGTNRTEAIANPEQLNRWGVIMAGAVIVIIPTLILLFLGQNKLQTGLTEGALK